jgi:hypothetical protein
MRFRRRKREHQEREMPATMLPSITEVDGCARTGSVDKRKKR